MSYIKYLEQLTQHDWLYSYSDDHSVWKRGEEASKKLAEQSEVDSTYKFMYVEFIEWVNGNREKPTLEDFKDNF